MKINIIKNYWKIQKINKIIYLILRGNNKIITEYILIKMIYNFLITNKMR